MARTRRPATRAERRQALVAALLATLFVLASCGFRGASDESVDDDVRRALAESKDHPDLAAADFDRAVALAPGTSFPLAVRGRFRAERGDTAHALADLDRAIALGPSAELYYWRGLVYEQIHEYPRAVADCTHAIELDPKLADAYAHRCASRALGPKKEWKRASADCEKAIALGPDRSAGYFSRALVHFLQMRNPHRIVADCDKAIALDPGHYQAYALRAAVHDASGQHARACADTRRARALHPHGSATWEATLTQLERACAPAARPKPAAVARAGAAAQ